MTSKNPVLSPSHRRGEGQSVRAAHRRRRSWRRRLGVGLVAAIVLLVGGSYGIWQLSNARTFQLAGDLVPRVDTTEPVVALTFDDGPVPDRVDAVLAPLRAAKVKATFFVIGESLAQSPDAGRRLVADGHQLGNHSYTHQRMIFRSSAFYAQEIEDTDAQIRAAGFDGPIVFRPPFGKKLLGLPLYLASTGRTTVTWDVEMDPAADVTGTAEEMVATTLAEARPGSIILLHPWYDRRGEAIRAIGPIVAGLRERGYRFVTVAELLTPGSLRLDGALHDPLDDALLGDGVEDQDR
jgi:peptidoglycan-N-acetylglucosamine deacetylase